MIERRIVRVLPLLFLLGGIGACDAPTKNERPLVVTSIPPLGDWIAAVGGQDVDVLVLVPPAANPHTFELSPGQLREASRASLVVLNGAGLEFWSDRLLDNLRDATTPVLTLSDGVELVQDGHEHAHDHSDEHRGEVNHLAPGNPHFWLDPITVTTSVDRIAKALIGLLPERRDSITHRAAAYAQELRQLDRDVRAETATWSRKRFIGDHAAWVYFAKRYGLEEAGVIEELPGREISAREMAGLIRTMKTKDIGVVYADVRKSSRAADILGEETGARIARLDLLCSNGTTYIEMMRDNLARMREVMK